MQRIYHRDEQGLIQTTETKGWTARTYLDAHRHLEHAATETLLRWPDTVVDWYAIGGAGCCTERAVGFRVMDHAGLVRHVGRLRDRAGLSPAVTPQHKDLTIHGLVEVIQALALADTQARTVLSSAADGAHAMDLADGDLMADQQIEGERTTWDFPDGSRLVASGPVVGIEL